MLTSFVVRGFARFMRIYNGKGFNVPNSALSAFALFHNRTRLFSNIRVKTAHFKAGCEMLYLK